MRIDLTKYIEMGRRVRMRREALHLTQEELAEKARISTSFVGHIERMEKMASLDTMARLSVVLGVSLDYLVFGTRAVTCDRKHCAMYGDLRALMEAYNGRQEA